LRSSYTSPVSSISRPVIRSANSIPLPGVLPCEQRWAQTITGKGRQAGLDTPDKPKPVR
jgi:hypothetical protein